MYNKTDYVNHKHNKPTKEHEKQKRRNRPRKGFPMSGFRPTWVMSVQRDTTDLILQVPEREDHKNKTPPSTQTKHENHKTKIPTKKHK